MIHILYIYMNNLSQFKTKQNLSILWDVLLDELNINSLNKTLISNINTVFESNINPFLSKASQRLSIMELNKQFLSQVVLAVNRLFPQLKQDENIKRITITDEEIIEPYKIEDIQSSRQTNFEKEVKNKQIDLENYMNPPKPKNLDFSDKKLNSGLDGKITEMGSLLAEKLAERNFEIEQLQNSNYSSANINPETWLKPKETSVKNENNEYNEKQSTNTNNRLKYLNIDNDNNISLVINTNSPKTQRRVSWNENNTEEPVSNIFQKLKRSDMNTNLEKDNSQETKQYIEQKSMNLPEIKQEIIQRNNVTSSTQILPIIPNNEFIKQINDMNTKIDGLVNIITTLTNSIQELLLNKSNENSL